MKRYLGYLPAILFLAIYLTAWFTGASMELALVLIWLGCLIFAGILLHKGIFWGGVFGALPALHMVYRGGIEILIGLALLAFYLVLGIRVRKNRAETTNRDILVFVAKIALTVAALVISAYAAVIGSLILTSEGLNPLLATLWMLVLPSLLLPMIWLKKRKKYLVVWGICAGTYFLALGIWYGVKKYDESITINTAPNINIHEYLPFEAESKIVKIDSQTLELTEDLPVIDGAAALFPV